MGEGNKERPEEMEERRDERQEEEGEELPLGVDFFLICLEKRNRNENLHRHDDFLQHSPGH